MTHYKCQIKILNFTKFIRTFYAFVSQIRVAGIRFQGQDENWTDLHGFIAYMTLNRWLRNHNLVPFTMIKYYSNILRMSLRTWQYTSLFHGPIFQNCQNNDD